MTESDLEKLNEGRLLRDASSHLLPLLTKMRHDVLARIVMAHKESKHELLPGHAAELSVISDLESKITRNNKETAHREEKLYEHSRSDDESRN